MEHPVEESGVISAVPCNGCTRCCHNDAVRILPHEDASRWLTEPHPHLKGARMLAHKANRDCIYLKANGCSIHQSKPQVCREMDCRIVARNVPYERAIQWHDRGMLDIGVWLRGRALLSGAK